MQVLLSTWSTLPCWGKSWLHQQHQHEQLETQSQGSPKDNRSDKGLLTSQGSYLQVVIQLCLPLLQKATIQTLESPPAWETDTSHMTLSNSYSQSHSLQQSRRTHRFFENQVQVMEVTISSRYYPNFRFPIWSVSDDLDCIHPILLSTVMTHTYTTICPITQAESLSYT